MSINQVTYYEVVCDEPGCGTRTGDLSDYAAWADHGQAADNWLDHDGIVLDSGRAFCGEHRAGKACDECGDEGDDLTETDEGEFLCLPCVPPKVEP